MTTPKSDPKCHWCEIANPFSYQFCPQCGRRVARLCPDCGSRIRIETQTCGHCNHDLANTGLGITNQRATEWWTHFYTEFPDFAQLWQPQGYGTTIAQQTKQIPYEKVSEPRLSNQVIAFTLPIANMTWCFNAVSVENKSITNGAVGAGTFRLSIVDLNARRRHSVRYEALESVKRNGDNFELAIQDGDVIHFSLKTPRPSKISTAGLVIESLINNFGSKTWSDQELSRQAWNPKADSHRQNVEAADAYANSIYSLFLEIIHETRRFDLAHPTW